MYSEILKYVRSYFVIFSKNMKYAIVFVSTSKYSYVHYQRIYTEIRSYLATTVFNFVYEQMRLRIAQRKIKVRKLGLHELFGEFYFKHFCPLHQKNAYQVWIFL